MTEHEWKRSPEFDHFIPRQITKNAVLKAIEIKVYVCLRCGYKINLEEGDDPLEYEKYINTSDCDLVIINRIHDS